MDCKRVWVLLLPTLILFNACGYYSFKGSLPSHYKAIAVPLFDDRTDYPGIREDLTYGVSDAFMEDNTLKVLDETRADILLTGTINSITQQEANVESGELTSSYKLTVAVKVKCEDIKTDKVLYDKTLRQYAFLDAQAGLEERDQAMEEIIALLIDDIVNATLGMW